MVGLFALLLSLAACHKPRSVDLDVLAIHEDLKRNLPIGSTRQQVEAYLDQKKVSHSYSGQDYPTPEYKNAEVAWFLIPDQDHNIVQTEVQAIFHFDPTGTRMIGFGLKAMYKGP